MVDFQERPRPTKEKTTNVERVPCCPHFEDIAYNRTQISEQHPCYIPMQGSLHKGNSKEVILSGMPQDVLGKRKKHKNTH